VLTDPKRRPSARKALLEAPVEGDKKLVAEDLHIQRYESKGNQRKTNANKITFFLQFDDEANVIHWVPICLRHWVSERKQLR
jgi:hypothetical protein